MLIIYSPGITPLNVTISLFSGNKIVPAAVVTSSFLFPRSSLSRCIKPGSLERNQTKLPTGSSTYVSTSSSKSSGHMTVIKNSALTSISALLAIGLINKKDTINKKTKPIKTLNNKSTNGKLL